MQIVHTQDQQADAVGLAVPALLLAAPEAEGAAMIVLRIAGFGSRVDRMANSRAAVAALTDERQAYALLVVDCDSLGGLAAGEVVMQNLRAAGSGLPVILISAECRAQVFPDDPLEPVLLRAPLSAVSLRVGFEHALRDLVCWRAA